MKKILLLAFFSVLMFAPVMVFAAGLVPCGNPGEPACTIGHFFVMLSNIYDFIVKYLATPLAVIALTVGGIMMLVSGGNPGLQKMGRDIIFSAIIGLCLAFGSLLIIKTLLSAMGFIYIDTLQ
jgi:type IV secretory pathway VirB2 component (pilin)